jgi:hypothetical protein
MRKRRKGSRRRFLPGDAAITDALAGFEKDELDEDE